VNESDLLGYELMILLRTEGKSARGQNLQHILWEWMKEMTHLSKSLVITFLVTQFPSNIHWQLIWTHPGCTTH
jgi:hypothetical protein